MEPIAIIGMACRFPAANDTSALWELLIDGKHAITEVPPDRWNLKDVYDPRIGTPGKMNIRTGGFLEQIDHFDAEFFGISEREAHFMDPQQRLVLEVAWEALETAGVVPATLAESYTGVFLGISNFDYNRLMCRDFATMDAYSSTGTILAIAANRISYLLNLRGPSLAVDTACSSSLVAVHLACQSLRCGESDLALAGGVNAILSPEVTIILSQSGLLSSGGICRAFDQEADGYVRSEGCGMVVLKRLSNAIHDGDPIRAIIRGSAVNQDGATNGLTAPSASAQQAVIREALKNADVAPSEITYLEAHGTGTPLGDIIEMRALKAVLAAGRTNESRCAISSIKTNIGHAESAAGIAGLIKVVLCLEHEEVPSHVHKNLNHHIKLEKTPLFVPSELQPWPRGAQPRFAGVSSFGIGGTNAHAIIQEGPDPQLPSQCQCNFPHILALSAGSAYGLRVLAERYDAFLTHDTSGSLADICFSANRGRSHFSYRLAIVAGTIEELRAGLAAFRAGRFASGVLCGQAPNRIPVEVGFLFNGLPSGSPIEPSTVLLLEYSIVKKLDNWGIRPRAVSGCGIGKYTAACIAGLLTLEEGIAALSNPELDGSREPRWICSADATAHSQIQMIGSVGGSDLFRGLYDHGCQVCVEIGPPSTAAGVLAELYCSGVCVNWSAFYSGCTHRQLRLPTYPFDHKRFWFTNAEIATEPRAMRRIASKS